MTFHGIDELGFHGLGNEEEAAELKQALETLRRLYHQNHFIGDMMCVFGRNFGFGRDPGFLAAVGRNIAMPPDKSRIWRLHTLVWAARHALKLPGDFVECGVFLGLSAGTMIDTLGEAAAEKTIWLYDTFDGLTETYSSATERARAPTNYGQAGLFEAVRDRFSAHPNVRVVQGVVPDVLGQACPEQIVLLHLDMNAAKAEIGALERLFDLVVAGGLVVFDDFGHIAGREQFDAETAWMAARDYAVLELPTGQGLVVKR